VKKNDRWKGAIPIGFLQKAFDRVDWGTFDRFAAFTRETELQRSHKVAGAFETDAFHRERMVVAMPNRQNEAYRTQD